MDLAVFKEYLVVVVVLICLCVGYILKNIIPTDKINKYIPLIMGVLGVVLNLWICKWNFTPEVLLEGLASGLASTGLHQAFTKLINNHNME